MRPSLAAGPARRSDLPAGLRAAPATRVLRRHPAPPAAAAAAAAAAPVHFPAMLPKLLTTAAFIAAPLFAAQVVGAACFFDIKDWYIPKVRKPWFTPPILAFPLIWTTLYIAMGYASFRVFAAGGGALPLGLYAVQLTLNLAWQPVLFKGRSFRAAFKEVSALLVAVAATLVAFWRVDRTACYLMIPYAAFSAFAARLTYAFWEMNGDKVE